MKAIYSILNKLNGHQYIGSAIHFYKRKYHHLWQLNKNIHHSPYLQRAYDKYGEDMFEFIILEHVEDEEQLLIREQWWIDNSHCEYNICKTAGSNLGYKWTDEQKRERCELYEKQGHHRKGVKNSEEHIALRRPFIIKPIIQYSKKGEFIKEWESIIDASKTLKICYSCIVLCCRGKHKTAGKFKWEYKK